MKFAQPSIEIKIGREIDGEGQMIPVVRSTVHEDGTTTHRDKSNKRNSIHENDTNPVVYLMNRNETCQYMMSQNDKTRKENLDLRKDKLIVSTLQETCTNTTESI